MTALLDTRSPAATFSAATTARMSAMPATPATALLTAEGWHEDPWHLHDLRYHDGSGWTDHVTHFGPVPCTGCRCGH